MSHRVPMRWPAAAALAGAALLLAARPSHADPQAEAQGALLFAQGRALRKGGNCTDALLLFREAYQVYPEGLGSLRNTAECEEALSHPALAYRAWVALKQALAARAEPKYAGWDQDAEMAIGRLGPQLVSSRAGLPSALPVSTALGGAPAPSAPAAKEAPRPTPPPANDTVARSAGWVAVGIGAAGALGLVASVAVRQSALSAVDSQCGSHAQCSPSLESADERGHTASVLANVFGAIAIAGMTTGVVLLTIEWPPPRPRPHSVAAALRVSATGMNVVGSF